MDFKGFREVLPNFVYALHDYSIMGFPTSKPFEGIDAQKQLLAKQFAKNSEFHRVNKVPIWNGEFDPVYETNAEHINQQRYSLLGEQFKIYGKAQIS